MLTSAIQVQRYVRASAGRAGLSVVFEECNQPRHDGKTIFLPRITGATTNKELKEMMSSTDHEVAHDLYSCFKVLKDKDLDPKGILMFTWNFLEDSRVNVIEATEYLGFRRNWDETSAPLLEKILTKASTEKGSPIAVLITALIKWETKLSADLFPLCEMAVTSFEPVPAVLDVLNNFSDRLLECQEIKDKELGTKATYQLAYDILTAMGKDVDEEEQEAKKKLAAKGDKGNMDGEGEETKASETDADDSTDGEDTAGKLKDDKREKFEIIKVVLTVDDLKKFSVTTPEDGREAGNTGVNFDPVDLKHASWDMTDYSNFKVVDYPKHIGAPHFFVPSSDWVRSYETRVAGKMVAQENFAQQVRRLIQIRAKVQRTYGVKKGKLDSSRLSRICFEAPGFNERVFKNKIENKILDAAITVLVDMSGSMKGDKVCNALSSTILMNEVCSTLNIPLEVIGFTDIAGYDTAVPLMFVYKGFSDHKVSETKLKEFFGSSSCFMSGNPDGENILWAHDRLLKRKERRRLLIVMSDGSPAASKHSHGLEKFTLKVIREIEQSREIEIYGLGLCSNSVKEYYKEHSVVNTPDEIPSKLLQLIERKLLT